MKSFNLTNEELQKIRNIQISDILNVKRGHRGKFFIRCPVHTERTGSFVVYDNNSYHCFGCGAHGYGAIDFTMALGYTFTESLEELVKYL